MHQALQRIVLMVFGDLNWQTASRLVHFEKFIQIREIVCKFGKI